MRVVKIPIKTHLVTPYDDIVDLAIIYAKPHLKEGDILLVTSKIVSITQHRIKHFDKIKVGFWANILWRFVTVPKFGVGAIGLPEKMQAAIDEVGIFRVLAAACVAGITRLLGRRGDFFRIAGHKTAEIDGTRILTFEPYIRVVIFGPVRGDEEAQRVKEAVGCEVAIIDAGDWGDVDVLGASDGLDYSRRRWVEEMCRDNPLGQTMEQTPLGILRVEE
ncbi:MAG: F420-0--gamma-glutamyl ligase [Candidatus Coatesbacteria bacterium]|nr:MAG: F420-0--gamma-glutamyl ligase [Candidatus Coatesbacteria bacterium]